MTAGPLELFGDIDLARRLESFQADVCAAAAEAMVRVNPGSAAAVLDVANGRAIFAGANSPVTQAIGVALGGSIDTEAFEKLEAFYRSHGSDSVVQVTPWTDPSLLAFLGRHRYAIAEFENVFVRSTATEDPPAGMRIEEVGPEQIPLWSRISAEGFATDAIPVDLLIEVMTPFAYARGSRCYLAYVDGQLAGAATAFFSPQQRIVGLFGASTLPPLRNRGVQTALLRRRLADGAGIGCDTALVTTLPGSGSHRNVSRHGFGLAYTKATFRRALD